jgi:membrane protein
VASFFAVFSLALLGFAIIGSVVPDAALITAMQVHLPGTLPRPDAAALRDARSAAELIGFVVWPISGGVLGRRLTFLDARYWELPQYPGRFWPRQLINLTMLAGIGLLLTVSLAPGLGPQGNLPD